MYSLPIYSLISFCTDTVNLSGLITLMIMSLWKREASDHFAGHLSEKGSTEL